MSEDTAIASKTKIFISYSRRNKLFVRKLNDALDAMGVDAWVDWEGIPLSSDWMAEITAAIEGADAFVFVISSDSLKSKVCGDELELAIKHNKKVIPVLYLEPAKGQKMHPKLASTNWVYMRPKKDDFKATVPKLKDAIETDLGWVQKHTRLLLRASEWEQRERNRSYLLQGTDLEDGEGWMREATVKPGREVTPLQADYIGISRRISVQRQRNLMIGIAVALVISVFASIYAFQQRELANDNATRAISSQATSVANEFARATQQALAEEHQKIAEENAQIAEARRSAAEAKIYQSKAGELGVSTLLAIDAYSKLPSLYDAEDILRNNIAMLAKPVSLANTGARIQKIQISPDGKKFVTSDTGGKACVWDMETGEQFFCTQQDGELNDAVFTKDGSAVVTGGSTGEVVVWDAETGEKKSAFNFDSVVWDLNSHPNGTWVGVGTAAGIGVIDVQKGSLAHYYQMPSDVYNIEFGAGGKYMAAGMASGDVSVWVVGENRTLAGPKHNGSVLEVEFSPDGLWVASTGMDSALRMMRIGDGRQKYFIQHGDWVEYAAFAPDSSWFVTASDDFSLRVIDTLTGQERFRMKHTNFIGRVRISSDGQWIASTGHDHTARIWDASSGAQAAEIPVMGIGVAIVFSEDASRLVVADRLGNVDLWDISRLKARSRVVKFTDYLHEAHFSADGKWLVANTDDRNLWLVPAETAGSPQDGRKPLFTTKGLTYGMDVSPDSLWVAALEYDSSIAEYNRVILADLAQTKKFTLSHNTVVMEDVVFTPDSQMVITCADDGSVILWNTQTGEKIKSFQVDGIALNLSVSPDGKYLALAMEEGDHTLVWDLTTLQQAADLPQVGSIHAAQFSADGKILATGSSESIVAFWDIADGRFQPRQEVFDAGDSISTLAFNPAGSLLAVGDAGGYVYLWDMAARQEVARLRQISNVTGLSFSADGAQLSIAASKNADIWDVQKIPMVRREEIIADACAHLTENLTQSKWRTLFFDEEYRLICPDLPAGSN